MLKTKSKTIEIPPLGPVLFEKSKRARRLNISLRPFKGVRVTVPLRVSFRRAHEFMVENLEWADKHLVKVRQFELDHQEVNRRAGEVDWGHAREFLIQRLAELADKYEFTYNRVFIRNQKTRWGSCSADNNINLNIALVTLPGELLDYVILHELAHTRIKNHSRPYWQLLDKLLGNAKEYDRQLRKYHPIRRKRKRGHS